MLALELADAPPDRDDLPVIDVDGLPVRLELRPA